MTEYVLIGKASSRGVYHTDENCPSAQSIEKITRVEKEMYDHLDECKNCSEMEVNSSPNGGEKYTDCPYCGESVYHLSKHIPNCGET